LISFMNENVKKDLFRLTMPESHKEFRAAGVRFYLLSTQTFRAAGVFRLGRCRGNWPFSKEKVRSYGIIFHIIANFVWGDLEEMIDFQIRKQRSQRVQKVFPNSHDQGCVL